MQRFIITFILTAIAAAALASHASATQQCQRESIFGSVANVESANRFNLASTREQFTYIHVYHYRETLFHDNGLTLRPGVYAGIFGCYSPDHRSFRAEEITLSSTPANYNGYQRKTVSVVGTVTSIEPSYLEMDTSMGHMKVYTSRKGYRVGERLSVRGNFSPMDGSFNAASITPVP
ncbi:MAG: hypothetical protein ACXWNK_01630 [Vulcanimicrobiaceae bacterium]